MLVRLVGPCVRNVGGLRIIGCTLHDGKHVGVADVQNRAHLPADRGERLAVDSETVGVRIHVVKRAYQAPIRGECRRSGDQIEPLGVRVFFEHGGGAVVLDLEHLVMVLQPVLHEQQRTMPCRPPHDGEILVRLAVPCDAPGVHAAVLAVPVEFKVNQGEEDVRVAGQSLWITT